MQKKFDGVSATKTSTRTEMAIGGTKIYMYVSQIWYDRGATLSKT